MVNNNSWRIIINKLSYFEFQKGITSFVNPYSMLMLKDREDIAAGVDHWYVDGIALVKLVHGLFKKKVARLSFDDTSLAPIIFANVAQQKQRLAIIGTQFDVIEKSVKFIEDKYALTVHYFRNGFMKADEEQQAIEEIITEAIEVVVCGMGTPRQEEFLMKLKMAGWNGYSYTCGGYLHQIADKNKNYYPVIFDKLHLRWLYRIYDEPKLVSRYLIQYPKFFVNLLFFRKSITKRQN